MIAEYDSDSDSTPWEGEGPRGYPAEPHSLARTDRRLRFGRSPTLPSRRNIFTAMSRLAHTASAGSQTLAASATGAASVGAIILKTYNHFLRQALQN